jgi:hypothetical protein
MQTEKMHGENLDWVPFITETGIKAKFKIIGNDKKNDVKIKITSSMPKSYFYSALNEVGLYYDEIILPTLK